MTILADSTTTYQVTVGGGGAKASGSNVGANGSPSHFHSAIAMGGGRGGQYATPVAIVGGSGGGSARWSTSNSSEQSRYAPRMLATAGVQGFNGADGSCRGAELRRYGIRQQVRG